MIMRKVSYIILNLLLMLLPVASEAQVLSFEEVNDLFSWKAEGGGKVSLTNQHYKFGTQSLKIDWKPGTEVVFSNSAAMFEASRSRHGGITVWFYDEGSDPGVETPSEMQIIFLTTDDRPVASIPFRLGYKGWRAMWAKFNQDMGKKPHDVIGKMKLVFPQTSGTLCIDMLEFPATVPWKYMEDAHYSTSRTSFSMIPDIMKYREAVPSGDDVIEATDEQIQMIEDRFRNWCLGTGAYAKDKFVKMRTNAEKTFISKGLAAAEKIAVAYDDAGTPVGEPLFTLDGPAIVEGKKLAQFRSVNESVLIPLALDYCKNSNTASLEKAKYIYDWFNDQGWADGSSMGTIVLEKLRSSGYIYSLFLLKDQLSPEVFARERAALNWFTMFGHCYVLENRNGVNSDDLRALANGKLIYALSLDNPAERRTALTAFKRYMDKAMGVAPGGEDVIKDDYSGYHHRTAYNSGYYPQALYAGAQIAWMLRGTPYAMCEESFNNIKKGLKTFHFLCAGLDIPAGTVGRFPKAQKILHEMIPAYAYAILCDEGQDKELLAIFRDVLDKSLKDPAWSKYVTGVNSDMSYMTTVGEMEAVAQASSLNLPQVPMKTGALFMPFSGLHISKDELVHFNVKGYSRHIWDYEAGTNGLNRYGRWISNGQLEFFDFRNGNRSFRPADELFDWNHIPGTTSKVLSLKALAYNDKSTDHRNYSDQSFLAGVYGADKVSMFSFRLHDIYADTSFRADKSYFFFEDAVLCLGSGVSSRDRKNIVATTLFQDLQGAGKQKSETLFEDASFAYVVSEGTVDFVKEGKFSKAYINHGAAPKASGYEYYIVKNKADAGKFVAGKSPVRVLSKDDSAHIVERDGVVCAALFKSDADFEGMLVRRVNIPLAYILEDKGSGEYSLSLCEPDMRRSWKLNMNNLNDDEVAEEGKPFDTAIVLDGDFDIIGESNGFSVEKADGRTILSLTTVKARNYKVNLKKNK